ncbi:retrovirus-related pol polyprotein from transposon TNT 1-94 [Tanacetum coccineum]
MRVEDVGAGSTSLPVMSYNGHVASLLSILPYLCLMLYIRCKISNSLHLQWPCYSRALQIVVHFSRSGAPYSDAQVPESWTPPIHRPHLRSPSVGCAHSPTSDAECEPSMSFDSTPSSPYSSEDDNPPTDTKWDSNRSLNIQWMAARHNEMEALKQNCTWTLVPRPSASNIVGYKWVYRIKYHADGSVERFKARVVAQGFTQIPGLDYSHTFSPVVKASTVRIVLSLAVLSFGVLTSVRLSQNAFLMGHLNEDVYWSNHQGSLIRNFQIMYANYPRHFTV